MKIKDMIKVRFNLSRGINYMKWKVSSKYGTVYLNPNDVTLILTKCILKNQKKAALKIYNGGHKTVCSWILCEHIDIINNPKTEHNINTNELVYYNPRVNPNWIYNGENADGFKFDNLITSNDKVYKLDI